MKKIGVVGVSGGWSSEELKTALGRTTGYGVLLDLNDLVCDLSGGAVMVNNVNLLDLDALIVKKIGIHYSPELLDRLLILEFLESKGMRIFSRPGNIRLLLNRLECTMRLQVSGIPIPETVITGSVDQAVEAVQRFGRAVFKPLYTSKARGMRMIEDDAQARSKIEMFKSEGNALMYIQKFVEIPGKDLGISFLGGKYIATYARVKGSNSWNSTTLNGGKYEAYSPSQEIIDLAYRAQALFKLDFTCVDLAETSSGPLVFEVSAFGGFKGLKVANNVDAAQLYVNYVLGQLN